MMICPETYYETRLKGKNKSQILLEIRGLKREIANLKRTMEHPNYQSLIRPSESTQLQCIRLYLDRAKQAYKEAGGTYVPTSTEKRIAEFDDSIPYITQIVFKIGGFPCEQAIHTLTIANEKAKYSYDGLRREPQDELRKEWAQTTEEFQQKFRELHIGEWRRNYSTERFGYSVLDGTRWQLRIDFSNGHKIEKYYGSNAYPYNFEEFEELFIDETDDEE